MRQRAERVLHVQFADPHTSLDEYEYASQVGFDHNLHDKYFQIQSQCDVSC
jgi:hypothetical protein